MQSVRERMLPGTILPPAPGREGDEDTPEKEAPKPKPGLLVSQATRVWLTGTGAAIFLGVITGNKPLFALGVLLVAALGVSYLSARVSLRGLAIERRFGQTRAFFGEEVSLSYIVTNNKPLPVPWLALEDPVPATLEALTSVTGAHAGKQARRLKTSLTLSWYERVTIHHRLRCLERGEYDLSPIEAQSGDVFGIFRQFNMFDAPQTLLVYPRYVAVEELGIAARQPFGEEKAVRELATDPLRLRTVREYAAGDSLRAIHWKATARRARLQTKLFEPAATPQLFIFCNQDTFARVWEGIDRQSLELTITVAASLANHALDTGYMVGLQVNSFVSRADSTLRLAPSRSPHQFTRILENLARLRGWSGQPMEELLSAERRRLPRGASLVIATAVVTDELLHVLTALRRAGHPVTLVESTVSRGRYGSLGSKVPRESLGAVGIRYHSVNTPRRAQNVETISLPA